MLRLALAISAALVLTATAASAKNTAFEATVTKPTQGSTVVGGILWRCTDANCVTTSSTGGTSVASACRTLSREMGPVTSFTTAKGKIDDAALKKCNGE
jgi:hypothetical protein